VAVKTPFTPADLAELLSPYDLGTYIRAEPIQQGTVQTNFVVETTQGKFVLRYYENRSRESVLFERDLLLYLLARHYPCPAPIANLQGEYVGVCRAKPYAISEFIEGRHIEHPAGHHRQQLVQKAAELQRLTTDFHSPYTVYRWNYDPDLCRRLASAAATRLNTGSARRKLAWLVNQLAALDLPASLPRGICHCDFHFSNVLFRGDEFVALIDFDDANWTFLPFDLVGLIEYWAWPHPADLLDMAQARRTVQAYMAHRTLSPIEQQHLYDVYKLSILFDCVWYFGRGSAGDFYERHKIEALTDLGRQRFFDGLFHQ
jgi:homoserine kinase type II